jgi:His/Glu/Gln/Arg/opine family amino acid ABC transporter permease subunit
MSVVETFQYVAGGLDTTLVLTSAGFGMGAVIALPVAWARTCPIKGLRLLGGAYVEVARGIPPIVWLFLLYFGLNQFKLQMESMAAAIVGLGIIAGGYLAEIYRSGFAAVPDSQQEAARALSIPRVPAFLTVTAPQALVTIAPLAIVFFIGLLKDSAVASVIGVQDITALAVAASKRSYDGFTIFVIAGLVYVVVSVPTSMFGRWLGGVLSRRWAVDA